MMAEKGDRCVRHRRFSVAVLRRLGVDVGWTIGILHRLTDNRAEIKGSVGTGAPKDVLVFPFWEEALRCQDAVSDFVTAGLASVGIFYRSPCGASLLPLAAASALDAANFASDMGRRLQFSHCVGFRYRPAQAGVGLLDSWEHAARFDLRWRLRVRGRARVPRSAVVTSFGEAFTSSARSRFAGRSRRGRGS